ncbi:hypothetical protein V6767_03850 [Martelella sp. FLE1502]
MDFGSFLDRLKALGIKAPEEDARAAFGQAKHLALIGKKLAKGKVDAA